MCRRRRRGAVVAELCRQRRLSSEQGLRRVCGGATEEVQPRCRQHAAAFWLACGGRWVLLRRRHPHVRHHHPLAQRSSPRLRSHTLFQDHRRPPDLHRLHLPPPCVHVLCGLRSRGRHPDVPGSGGFFDLVDYDAVDSDAQGGNAIAGAGAVGGGSALEADVPGSDVRVDELYDEFYADRGDVVLFDVCASEEFVDVLDDELLLAGSDCEVDYDDFAVGADGVVCAVGQMVGGCTFDAATIILRRRLGQK